MRLIKYFNILLILIGSSVFVSFLIFFNTIGNHHLTISNSIERNLIYKQLVKHARPMLTNTSNNNNILDIECKIPENKSINCLQKGKDLYVPFEFIARKFDVSRTIWFIFNEFILSLFVDLTDERENRLKREP